MKCARYAPGKPHWRPKRSTDLAAIRAYVAAHLSGVQVALETYIDRRLDRIEARLDTFEAMLREALNK